MRAMQALPGVATGDDFQAEFSVRGSAFRHVGVVIDGTPTPLLLHAVRGADDTGSIAMINTDILSHGALFAGAHRAAARRLARRDARVRRARRHRAIGWRCAPPSAAPARRRSSRARSAARKRGSWLVSVRKSYLDWLVRKIEPGIDSTLGFVDAQRRSWSTTSRRASRCSCSCVGGDAVYKELQAGSPNGLLRATSSRGWSRSLWRYDRQPLGARPSACSFVGSDFRNRGVLDAGARARLHAALDRPHRLQRGARPRLDDRRRRRRERYRTNQILRDFVDASPRHAVRVRNRTRGHGGDDAARRLGASRRGARRPAASAPGCGSPAGRWRRGAGVVALGAGRTPRRTTDVRARRRRVGAVLRPDARPRRRHRSSRPERAPSFDVGVEHRARRGDRAGRSTAFGRSESRGAARRSARIASIPIRHVRIAESDVSDAIGALDRRHLARRGRRPDAPRRRRGSTGWIGYTWAHTQLPRHAHRRVFDGDFDQRHTLNVFAQQRLSYRLTVSAQAPRRQQLSASSGTSRSARKALWLAAERNRVRLPRLRAARSAGEPDVHVRSAAG